MSPQSETQVHSLEKRKAGRPKGVHHYKPTEDRIQARIPAYLKDFASEIIKSGCKLPLVFLVESMNNESIPIDIRIDCAKAAAPYIHRKMPVVIDMPHQEGSKTLIINASLDRLKDLSDDELATLTALASRVAEPRALEDGAGEAEEEQDKDPVPGEGELPA